MGTMGDEEGIIKLLKLYPFDFNDIVFYLGMTLTLSTPVTAMQNGGAVAVFVLYIITKT